jgi:hypothetical protein
LTCGGYDQPDRAVDRLLSFFFMAVVKKIRHGAGKSGKALPFPLGAATHPTPL